MRKVACAFGLVLALSATAAAQNTPKIDVFLGYSYVRKNGPNHFNSNGGSLALAYNLNNFLGIVGDVGLYRRRPRANAGSYLFGPRFSVRRNHKITPYAQALFGGARVSGSFFSGGSGNAFAMTAGGGVDANLTKSLGLRLLQVEYFLTKFQETSGRLLGPNKQDNLRISTGVVFRFGK
jgi:outer membrane immunogenic protein